MAWNLVGARNALGGCAVRRVRGGVRCARAVRRACASLSPLLSPSSVLPLSRACTARRMLAFRTAVRGGQVKKKEDRVEVRGDLRWEFFIPLN